MTELQIASALVDCTLPKTSEALSHTLHTTLAHLSEQLKASANALHPRRLTMNTRLHWQTRGQQGLLWCVAHHLQDLCVRYQAPCELLRALQDYLGCLEKYEIDVQEEQHIPVSRNGWAVNRWKAEGAAQELPTMFAAITQVIDTSASRIELADS